MICKACNSAYNYFKKTPHLLTVCGHSMCLECLARKFSRGLVYCPECGEKNFAEVVGEFPKNVSLLDASERFFKADKKRSSSIHSFSKEEFSSLQKEIGEFGGKAGLSILSQQNILYDKHKNSDEDSNYFRDKSFSDLNQKRSQAKWSEAHQRSGESLPNQKPETCGEHGKEFEAYCFNDQKVLCVSCLLERQHKDHEVDSIDRAFEKFKSLLLTSLNQLGSNDSVFGDMSIGKLEGVRTVLSENMEYAVRKVDVEFSEIENMIITRKNELIASIS
jgi:hypothetical protein